MMSKKRELEPSSSSSSMLLVDQIDTVKDKENNAIAAKKQASSSSSSLAEVVIHSCENLNESHPQFNARKSSTNAQSETALGQGSEYFKFMNQDDVCLSDIKRTCNLAPQVGAFLRAGPREHLYFDPMNSIAACVTVGGLCPGLNNVIRGLTNCLLKVYRVKKVLGFIGGFQGIYINDPMELTLANTRDIHLKGGTILSAARGGFDEEKIMQVLEKLQVTQLFIIGGDGTMRGAQALVEAFRKRPEYRPVSIIGIPKTIDNDIDIIDRSFGFLTAVEEAVRAIRAAKVEAESNFPQGCCVVKLMGRHAGFIAATASLASGQADCVLIPECEIRLNEILEHIKQVIFRHGNAVVVVAEGAGEELIGESAEFDAGGNRKLPEIGVFMKEKINAYLKANGFPSIGTRYIDPSYMVRSVPPCASDALYTLVISQHAVHAAMAGYTNCCVAEVNNHVVYVPIDVICRTSPRQLDPSGRLWAGVLAETQQPCQRRMKNLHIERHGVVGTKLN